MPRARLHCPNDALSRSQPRASDGAWIGCSTPRARDGNFHQTTDLTTLLDAASAQLSAGVLRATLHAAVRSLSRLRSRANFGARKLFPTRRSRAEEIELDEDQSQPLDSAP